MATKIYTKTGDKGSTALIGGTKVPKSHLRIESYGIVDELNSFIGLLGDYLAPGFTGPAPGFTGPTSTAPGSALSASPPEFAAIRTCLLEVQDRLFTIGSSLACDPEKEPKLRIPDLKEADVLALETHIDKMESTLPPMKSFLLPGGHVAVSTAHIVRCVCRRAERACVRLQEAQLFVDPLVLRYLNRLSDYFFVLARYLGHLLHAAEIPWKPRV
jgi:cob(I)alamin adenosyltransferase